MTYPELWHRLLPLYDEGEAKAIVRMVLDVGFGLSLADVYAGKVTQLSQDDTSKLHKMMDKLLQGVPVQYVLGCAHFAGRSFYVAKGVLIPRPETEELCAWMVQVCGEMARDGGAKTLLDVGTGSGCIAITMALDLPLWQVSAIDISPAALTIAKHNAERLCAKVQFSEQNALDLPRHDAVWDVIVSNPPYIESKVVDELDDEVKKYGATDGSQCVGKRTPFGPLCAQRTAPFVLRAYCSICHARLKTRWTPVF